MKKTRNDEEKQKLQRRIDFYKDRETQIRLDIGLFGRSFARAAQEKSMMVIANEAQKIAKQALTDEDYENYIKKRIGENGGFRISEEDLKYIKT